MTTKTYYIETLLVAAKEPARVSKRQNIGFSLGRKLIARYWRIFLSVGSEGGLGEVQKVNAN